MDSLQSLKIQVLDAEKVLSIERVADSCLPETPLGLFRGGIEHLNCGDARAALQCFERAVALEPGFANGHVGLGIAYAVDCQIYPAIDHLEEAAALEPHNFFAHFKLGQLYFKLRVPQKGYEAMRRALNCATSLDERRLVANLIREEKQREKNGIGRPWWSRPFSMGALLAGAGLLAALLGVLLAHVH
jgi:tetratricopeptide (TPR) repeat protein